MVKKDRIINKENFGSTSIVALFDDLDMEDKSRLEAHNIGVSQIPLQKLFIYLTENSLGKEAL